MAYRGNIDLISNMPLEIIEKILTYLPPREAVMTSVLARTWRYKWTTMSDLNFVDMGGWGTADELVKGIDGCLHLHQGPIRKFGIRFDPLVARQNILQWMCSVFRPRIHQWMCLVLKPDLEELQVEAWGSYYSFTSHVLFNCKKLTRLELHGCKLDVPPTFEGFPNLKILRLSFMEVDCKIGILISKSQLLESLSLSFNSSNDMITISAPKLKYFKLRGEFKDICLENAIMLVDMIIDLCTESKCNVIKLLGGAPNLERLRLHDFTKCFEVGFCQGVLSTTFNYLKIMKLSGVCLHEMEGIPLLLELLTSAPNLEKLVLTPIKSYPSKPKVKSSCWQKEYPQQNGFMKLKVIQMLGIFCVAPEIEFATFMLLNSPILEKMELRSSERKGAVIKRMYKKLPKLPRISARAEVTFHHDKDDYLWNTHFEKA